MQKIFVHSSFWFCPRSSQFKNRTSCPMFFVQLFFYSFVSTFVYKNCYYTCGMHIIVFVHIAVFKLCFQLTEQQQQQNVEVIDVLLCLSLMLLLWSQSVCLVGVLTVCASLLRPVEPDQIFLQVCVFWTFVRVCYVFIIVYGLIWFGFRNGLQLWREYWTVHKFAYNGVWASYAVDRMLKSSY